MSIRSAAGRAGARPVAGAAARAGLAGLVGAALALALAWLAAPDGVMTAPDTDQPAESAAAYGAALGARLRLADQALRALADDHGEAPSGRVPPGTTAQRYFDAIAYSADGASLASVHGSIAAVPALGKAAREDLARGDTVVATLAGSRSGNRVLMLRRISRPGAAHELVVAALAAPFLWEESPRAQDAGPLCVRDDADALLFCSAARLQAALAGLADSPLVESAGRLDWKYKDTQWRAGYYRLDLPVSAFSGRWTVIAAETAPSRPALAGLPAPAALALAAALLAGALAAWVAWRRLRPHPQGGDGADASTAFAAADDSGRAGRVGAGLMHQRRAISAMAEFDRAILSGADSGRLIALAASQMVGCVECTAVMCAVVDHEVTSRMAVVLAEAAEAAPRVIENICPAPATISLVDAHPDGCWSDRLDDFPFLAPLAERGAQSVLLLPLYEDARPAGVIALGLPDRAALGTDAAAFARALAVRLGVALTAAARARALYAHTHFDTVTGLPNRRYLKEHLGPQIARTRRDEQRLAALFIDLDDFRKVNAAAGHDRGDLILAEAAARLRNCLREEDTLTRFGGDEFVVVLPRIADGLDARKVADKLLAALARTFALAGDEFQLGASIGISVFPDDAQTVDEILRHADFAMFRAKAAGRGQYAFFDQEVNRKAGERTELEREMWHAIENREFVVFYQPQIALGNGRIEGAEALVRWMHPQRGMVPPGEFIPVAEQSSLIEQIGEQVLRAACAQYKAWEDAGIAPARISVNVTSMELKRADFADRIEAVLREFELRPFCLELEITESSILETSTRIIAQLERLRKRGIRIAFDDFGTGYSSLGYLKRLPVDVLKIDRSFVRDIDADADSASIARAIIDMAHHLGKSVVAEGIETEHQRALLESLGCETGQGFLWSRAVPADQFEDLVRAGQAAQRRPPVLRLAGA